MSSVTGHEYTSTRVRGLAPWTPKAKTLAVLSAVTTVLDEYSEYLPLTARQIFYRLVGSTGYEKTEKAYSRLLEYLNRGRRSGMIPWSAIRDDGFDTSGGGGWDDPGQVISSVLYTAEAYTRDHQHGQPAFVEIWVEAAGMMPQVRDMVSDYSIPIYSSGGFNSTTSKYDSARRINTRYHREDRPTRVLHIGDYDPSGVAIIDSLADDISAFLDDLGAPYAAAARFARLAITPEQIDDLELPGAPAKRTDVRGGFDDLTVQAEALAPPQLEALILDEIREEWDVNVYDELLIAEALEREALVEALSAIEFTGL